VNINKDTQLCISLSARPGNFGTRFQNSLFEALNLNYVYKAFKTDDIKGAIAGIRALNIRGSAISMPFKEACIELIDELDATARGIMSVNTIVNTGGHLKGYNTDYAAAVSLLKKNEISNELTFAVQGSGGMAKAVVCALRDLDFKSGTVVARNQKTGEALASQYGYTWKKELGQDRPDFLINVTPIGMAGGKESQDLPFSKEAIRHAKAVFDVVAVPPETSLIQEARKLNKAVITGADVIVLQAVEQFVLYTGVRPDAKLIRLASDSAFSS